MRGRGEFQLIVEHMEEAGSGALQRAYEALKQRLGQEGLFDESLKQSLPALPKTIGVVSSPDGAAVHDILSVLKRRFPSIRVILYPVSVQGEGSIEQISNALYIAEQRQECDVLIVGRGGGSLEDLWSFNDEKVARAIAAMTIPTISAVGHEIDFTIADFVADVRAPTPSAAAELAAPEYSELVKNIALQQQRLRKSIQDKLATQQQHIRYLMQRLPKPAFKLNVQQQHVKQLSQRLLLNQQRLLQNKQQQLDIVTSRIKHPQASIELQQQKLANLRSRMQQAVQKKLQALTSANHVLQQQLMHVSPLPFIEQQQQKLALHEQQLHKTMSHQLQNRKARLAQQMRTLAAVSPLSTLERGYSITTDMDTEQVLFSSNDVEQGQRVNVRLHQGQLECEVRKVKHND